MMDYLLMLVKVQSNTTLTQLLKNIHDGQFILPFFFILEVFYLKRIKMKTSMAGNDFSYVPGDELDVKNEVADAWRNAGIADIVEEEEKTKAKKKKSDV